MVDDRLAEAARVTAQWRGALRGRSQNHRISDALTELAWADRALAEIEAALTGSTSAEPLADAGATTEALF